MEPIVNNHTNCQGWSEEGAENLRRHLYRFFSKKKSQDFVIESGPVLDEFKERFQELNRYQKPFTHKRDQAELEAIHSLIGELSRRVNGLGPWGQWAFRNTWPEVASSEALRLVRAEEAQETDMEFLRRLSLCIWLFFKMDLPKVLKLLEQATQDAMAKARMYSEIIPGGYDRHRRELDLFMSVAMAKRFKNVFGRDIGQTVDGAFSGLVILAFLDCGIDVPEDQRRLIGKTQDFLKHHAACSGSNECKHKDWICSRS